MLVRRARSHARASAPSNERRLAMPGQAVERDQGRERAIAVGEREREQQRLERDPRAERAREVQPRQQDPVQVQIVDDDPDRHEDEGDQVEPRRREALAARDDPANEEQHEERRLDDLFDRFPRGVPEREAFGGDRRDVEDEDREA